ncbi:MAG: ferritin family protein [Thermodesulfobacteriota bacterium]
MSEKDNARILDELSIAHSTEVKGYYFYKAAADMVDDEHGKNVFVNLAKDELNHIRAIKAISASVREGLGWMKFSEAVKKGSEEAGEGLPIFQGENELIERLKTNESDTNALHIAMENEEEAVKFYSRLLNEATDPMEKTLLTELLEMEKGHLKVLRWESESVNATGFWCDMMEYSVEKEI